MDDLSCGTCKHTPQGTCPYRVGDCWGFCKWEAKDVITLQKDEKDVRSYNIGESDYAEHKIQPWDIWLEYDLNPWDADIVKRVLRDKECDSRKLDYEKIVHICQERIRQIDAST